MKSVHKFPLPTIAPGLFHLDIPGFLQILSSEEQYGRIVLYALTESNEPMRTVQIRVLTTGEMLLFDNFNFLDTVMMENGNYVLHIFTHVE